MSGAMEHVWYALVVAAFGTGWLIGLIVPSNNRPAWAVLPAILLPVGGLIAAFLVWPGA